MTPGRQAPCSRRFICQAQQPCSPPCRHHTERACHLRTGPRVGKPSRGESGPFVGACYPRGHTVLSESLPRQRCEAKPGDYTRRARGQPRGHSILWVIRELPEDRTESRVFPGTDLARGDSHDLRRKATRHRDAPHARRHGPMTSPTHPAGVDQYPDPSLGRGQRSGSPGSISAPSRAS